MRTLFIYCDLIFLLVILFPKLGYCIDSISDQAFKYYYDLAYNYRNIDSDSVLFFSKKALNVAISRKDYNNQVTALIFLSKAQVKIGNFSKALVNMNKALDIVEIYKLVERRKECLINQGSVYQDVGLNNEALKLYVSAQKIKENSKERFIDIVDLNYYLGSLYLEINRINEGRNYLRKSARISIENDFDVGALAAFILLSNSFADIDSINYYTSITEDIISKNNKLSYEQIVILNNKALIYKYMNDYNAAKKCYEKAIYLATQNKFDDYLATLYNNYSYLLVALSQFDSAQILLRKGLEISKTFDLMSLIGSIYDSYSDYYYALGNYKSAYLYKDSANVTKQKVELNKQIQQSLFLSTVFETEKKEKEILTQKNKNFTLWVYLVIVLLLLVLLAIFLLYYRQKLQLNKARVVALEKDKKLDVANALIEGQDAERKRLAMDLHDGLGASLGTLRLAFDSELKENIRYHELTNLIDDIRQTVRDMSHRMMPTRLDKLGLIPSINNLAVSISNTGKFTVDFKTNISKRLSGNLEINIYYLIYELVNNAIRHSNGNTIFVELIDHDDLISLSVIDNGTEFKSDEFSDGMGLKNVKARIQYMDGELNVDTNGQETIFMVEIPMKR